MKMSFKLTFWTMLFIIVVVLALSYFMDTNVSQEGFGSYNYTANNNTKTKIAIYSTEKELIKLYDCLYFDESNGNIIEVISNNMKIQIRMMILQELILFNVHLEPSVSIWLIQIPTIIWL